MRRNRLLFLLLLITLLFAAWVLPIAIQTDQPAAIDFNRDHDKPLGLGALSYNRTWAPGKAAKVQYLVDRLHRPEFQGPFMSRVQGAYFVANLNKHYMGCLIPKVGCSNWLTYLREVEGIKTPPIRPGIKPKPWIYGRFASPEKGFYFLFELNGPPLRYKGLKEKSDTNWYSYRRERPISFQIFEDSLRHNRSFNWVAVRHPWRRLMSAYRSKYQGDCLHDAKCLATRYSVHTIQNTSAPLSFHEFVHALERVSPLEFMDSHFRPMHRLCNFPLIPYDYIANLENHTQLDELSHRMGYARTFTQVSKAKHKAQVYFGERVEEAFKCTKETVQLAERLYGRDAELLGFTFDEAYQSCEKYGLTSIPSKSALAESPE